MGEAFPIKKTTVLRDGYYWLWVNDDVDNAQIVEVIGERVYFFHLNDWYTHAALYDRFAIGPLRPPNMFVLHHITAFVPKSDEK